MSLKYRIYLLPRNWL